MTGSPTGRGATAAENGAGTLGSRTGVWAAGSGALLLASVLAACGSRTGLDIPADLSMAIRNRTNLTDHRFPDVLGVAA